MSGQDRIPLPPQSGPVGRQGEFSVVALDPGALERLMPMHMILEADGAILQAGRCLRKLRPDREVAGANLFEMFEIRRPRGARSVSELLAGEGGRLSLHMRDQTTASFKGVIVTLPGNNRVLLNLSFGFSLVEAVRNFDLTAADFAETDLAIEMLYLVEAKSAALQESKKLNLRLQGAKIAAEEQAFTDTLTGLKNRRAMDHVLARLRMDGVSYGLIHLDLDYFKQVNDTYGHAAGDEVLQVVARILVHETRERDMVARVGGDEFILIFQNLVDPTVLRGIGDRIICRLEMPISFGEVQLKISGSIGIATSESSRSAAVKEVLQVADLALYSSKRAGRSRATVAPSAIHPET